MFPAVNPNSEPERSTTCTCTLANPLRISRPSPEDLQLAGVGHLALEGVAGLIVDLPFAGPLCLLHARSRRGDHQRERVVRRAVEMDVARVPIEVGMPVGRGIAVVVLGIEP